MRLTSTVFKEGGDIPQRYSCDGENISPALWWDETPQGVQSFALIVEDPDIPDFVKAERGIDVFVHWVLFNIPPTVHGFEEDAAMGTAGVNTRGTPGYTGPCPPDRRHRYFFTLYALNIRLDLPGGATGDDVYHAMEGHILDKAELMGTYERSSAA